MRSSISVQDRLAIRELHDHYADAVYRVDAAVYADCWAEDAVWEIETNKVRGRAAILALWQHYMKDFEAVVMYVVSGTLEIEGNTGSGRWYVLDVSRTKDQRDAVLSAAYNDTYEKDGNGVWRFKSRRLELLLVPNMQTANTA